MDRRKNIEMDYLNYDEDIFDDKNQKKNEVPLLSQKNEELSLKDKIERFIHDKQDLINKQIFGEQEEAGYRLVYLDGQVHPKNDILNVNKNSDFGLLDFIQNFFQQNFCQVHNIWFLVVAFSEFIPDLKIGYQYVQMIGSFWYILVPASITVLAMFCRQFHDHYVKWQLEQKVNRDQYLKYEHNQRTPIISSEIKVGDIIEIQANQRVPADMVLLHANNSSGLVFVRSDQLDGESQWKQKYSIKLIQEYVDRGQNIQKLNATVYAPAPNNNSDEFDGYFKIDSDNGNSLREQLSVKNIIWANSEVTSGVTLGLVIYTGKESKNLMNIQQASTEWYYDQDVDHFSIILIFFTAMMSFMVQSIEIYSIYNWELHYFRNFFILSVIIPISVRISIELSYLYYSLCISCDQDIQGAVVREKAITKDLGQIQFLLIDKTGTLTQNDMIFNCLSLDSCSYTRDDAQNINKILQKTCSKHNCPMNDIILRAESQDFSQNLMSSNGKKILVKRNNDLILRDFITAMCLCNDVIPKNFQYISVYEATSPDEIALVKFAQMIGMNLLERTVNNITIQNPSQNIEKYEILDHFPFSSEQKKMGIILKNVDNGSILFYVKGADQVMINKIPEVKRAYVLDESERLGQLGLRTLVFGQKYLTEEQYQNWKQQYNEAIDYPLDRKTNLQRIIGYLENDMELLGLTGVEDRLQENVEETIEAMRVAGMKMWMLTGDKSETAISVSISTGLKSKNDDIYVIKDINDELDLQNKLNSYNNINGKKKTMLVIDGNTLQTCFKKHLKIFFEVCNTAPAVIVSRCSPDQKAQIAKYVKQFYKIKTCAIGDGGNDVSMIQESDIGIGIQSFAGQNAALSSDVSVMKFKDLQKLFFWHGRQIYRRNAIMKNYLYYRGVLLLILQVFFMAYFQNITILMFQEFTMGYATIFTILPSFSMMIDSDITQSEAVKYPILYKVLQKGRESNMKSFFCWMFQSLYQGTIMSLFSLFFYNNSFCDIVTISLVSVVIAEYFSINTMTQQINKFQLGLQFVSIVLYISLFYLSKLTLNPQNIRFLFILDVILMTMFCWLPFYYLKRIMSQHYPNDYEKLIKRIKLYN